MKSFSPENVEEALPPLQEAARILADIEIDAAAPDAEHFFALSRAALQQAESYMHMAALAQRRALVPRSYR